MTNNLETGRFYSWFPSFLGTKCWKTNHWMAELHLESVTVLGPVGTQNTIRKEGRLVFFFYSHMKLIVKFMNINPTSSRLFSACPPTPFCSLTQSWANRLRASVIFGVQTRDICLKKKKNPIHKDWASRKRSVRMRRGAQAWWKGKLPDLSYLTASVGRNHLVRGGGGLMEWFWLG